MIEAENIDVRLKSGRHILRGISLSLESVGVTAVVGANGAGKTTLLRLLSGRIRRLSGSLFINGVAVRPDGAQARRLTGYLPEGAPLYRRLTPAEFLRFVYRARGLDRQAWGDAPEVRRLGIDAVLHREIGGLSQGYKRRVALVGALAGGPPLLLLDEATSGLDENLRRDFLEMIRELSNDRQIILTTHHDEEIEALDAKVITLSDGRVVDSSEVRPDRRWR